MVAKPYPRKYEKSYKMFEDAKQVFLGGVQTSRLPFIPNRVPIYINRGKGSRCWDIDGNEYIDYSLSLGPIILGYANPDVTKAALQGLKEGCVFSLNHPVQNTLAGKVLEYTNDQDWVTFLKTGSCATSAAIRIARICTDRKKVVRMGYHGWHDWARIVGVPEEVKKLTLGSNPDPDYIERLFKKQGKDIAAFIVAPEGISTDAARVKEVLQCIRKITRRYGSLMILDEIKTAFRTLDGSVQNYFNIKPDLSTVSKSMANGLPISAVVGKKKWAKDAQKAWISSTFNGEITAMYGALATLDVLERTNGIERIWRRGGELIEKCNKAIDASGVEARAFAYPFPSMPFMEFTYKKDELVEKARKLFFSEIISHGIMCHPYHLWFISTSHTRKDINQTIEVFADAFKKVKKCL